MFFIKKKKQFNYGNFIKKAKKFSPFELEEYDNLIPHLKACKKEVQTKKPGLKLIAISDTHGYFAFGQDRLPTFLKGVAGYDLCVLLGDIHPYDLVQITELIPKNKILAIRGNHDSFDLYEREGIKEMSGKVVSYKGVSFACIEGSFRYKDRRFPSFSQYESLVVTDRMPYADVLISHDCMFEHSKNDIAHAGLAGITKYVYEHAPVLHIHGHVHKSYERVYDNGTVEKSVYLCEYLEI